VQACLEARTHYIDISGEPQVKLINNDAVLDLFVVVS
jgi:short subunit dehydrogenase-like uncharacterized protein